MQNRDEFETLREAVRLSPDNVPLRQHLAESLLNRGYAKQAEDEYRNALARSPDDTGLKIGLANTYYQQNKNSHALVIIEELVKSRGTPAAAYVLYARLLLRNGDVANAVAQYKNGIESDPSAGDDELAQMLGVDADTDNSEIVDGRLRAGWDDEPEQPEVNVDRPKISFDDVGGMQELKEEIRLKIIYPLQNPDIYKAYGKAIGGGILMYGPPGCGKTHLARATAGEINAGFISVGINDVLEMWIGNSERNLHDLFQQARQNTPCVLFFDEVDALGASRSDMKQSAGRHLINQFLSEMDGVKSSNDGVLILGATNAPWHLDSAFRRPGRFDRILFVPPPDTVARTEIMQIIGRDKPQQSIDFPQLGKKLKDFSGADLQAVFDIAIESKLQDAIKSGVPQPLTTRDLLAAGRKVKPSTREWFATARNYALYSNQGGAYDDILKYLGIQ